MLPPDPAWVKDHRWWPRWRCREPRPRPSRTATHEPLSPYGPFLGYSCPSNAHRANTGESYVNPEIAPKLKLTRDQEVAVVTLDDGKANALATADFRAQLALLDELERSDAGAVVLTGRAGYFSAGMNLKLLPTLTPREVGELVTLMGDVALRLFTYPLPVVAAVSGHALGAGAIFSLACDVRLFARGPFRFGLNEVPGGLPLPSFGVEVGRGSIPVELQLEAIAHGRVFSPDEAVALGLGESLHEAPQLLSAAVERARKLAELPRSAYQSTKQRLRGPFSDAAKSRVPGEIAEAVRALGGAG